MPLQLNAKQKEGARAPPNLRCPRHGPVDETAPRRGKVSIPADTPLKVHAFEKVGGVDSPARMPASRRVSLVASPVSHSAAGQRLACCCSGLSVMFFIPRNGLRALKAARRSISL